MSSYQIQNKNKIENLMEIFEKSSKLNDFEMMSSIQMGQKYQSNDIYQQSIKSPERHRILSLNSDDYYKKKHNLKNSDKKLDSISKIFIETDKEMQEAKFLMKNYNSKSNHEEPRKSKLSKLDGNYYILFINFIFIFS